MCIVVLIPCTLIIRSLSIAPCCDLSRRHVAGQQVCRGRRNGSDLFLNNSEYFMSGTTTLCRLGRGRDCAKGGSSDYPSFAASTDHKSCGGQLKQRLADC